MKKSEFDFIQSLDALDESKRLYIALNDRYLPIERGIELMTDGLLKEDCKKLFGRLKRGLAMIGNALSTLEDRFEDHLVEVVEVENEQCLI
jgi:hypothetical protein